MLSIKHITEEGINMAIISCDFKPAKVPHEQRMRIDLNYLDECHSTCVRS